MTADRTALKARLEQIAGLLRQIGRDAQTGTAPNLAEQIWDEADALSRAAALLDEPAGTRPDTPQLEDWQFSGVARCHIDSLRAELAEAHMTVQSLREIVDLTSEGRSISSLSAEVARAKKAEADLYGDGDT